MGEEAGAKTEKREAEATEKGQNVKKRKKKNEKVNTDMEIKKKKGGWLTRREPLKKKNQLTGRREIQNLRCNWEKIT